MTGWRQFGNGGLEEPHQKSSAQRVSSGTARSKNKTAKSAAGGARSNATAPAGGVAAARRFSVRSNREKTLRSALKRHKKTLKQLKKSPTARRGTVKDLKSDLKQIAKSRKSVGWSHPVSDRGRPQRFSVPSPPARQLDPAEDPKLWARVTSFCFPCQRRRFSAWRREFLGGPRCGRIEVCLATLRLRRKEWRTTGTFCFLGFARPRAVGLSTANSDGVRQFGGAVRCCRRDRLRCRWPAVEPARSRVPGSPLPSLRRRGDLGQFGFPLFRRAIAGVVLTGLRPSPTSRVFGCR